MKDITSYVNDRAPRMQYGTIQLFCKVHRGEVTNIDAVDITSHKLVSNEPYAEVTTIMLTLLKAQQHAQSDKTLSFNVVFNKQGMPDTLQVQDFSKL